MAFAAQQQWINTIEENFYRGTLGAIAIAGTDDKASINGEKVNIRNAGTPPEITKGNRTYPVQITSREDDTLTYTLYNYEMGPLRIDKLDQVQTDPDLVKSNVIDLIGSHGDRAGVETLISWYHYTTGKRVTTTGESVAAHAPSATSNRKALKAKDLLTAAGIMNKDVVPTLDRYCIVDSVMFAQLVDDLGYKQESMEVVSGLQMIVPPVYGFKVIEVPNVVYVESDGTVREFGATGTTTDQAVALCVQKRCASHAWTETDVKIDTTTVGYFAKALIEAWKYGGGSYRRTDKKGVVPIIQANT
jgi:hypothetical protein